MPLFDFKAFQRCSTLKTVRHFSHITGFCWALGSIILLFQWRGLQALGSRPWDRWGQHSEGTLAGGWQAVIEHFLWCMNKPNHSKDMEREQKSITKPQVSLHSCVKHPPTEQRGKEINTNSCYAQAVLGISCCVDQTRKEKREQRKRRREWWGSFWRPAPLSIVIRQLSSLSLLHIADALSPLDLLQWDFVVFFSQTICLLYSVCRDN